MPLTRGSRYANEKRFTPGRDGHSPFAGIRPRHIAAAPGVIEHTIALGQRLDLLALHYYNDDRSWWRILDANPHILDAGEIVLDKHEGATILIPSPVVGGGSR